MKKYLLTIIFVTFTALTYATPNYLPEDSPGNSTLVADITVTSDGDKYVWAPCASDSHMGGHHCSSNWYSSATTQTFNDGETSADFLDPGFEMRDTHVTFKGSCLSGEYAMTYDWCSLAHAEANIANPKDGQFHTFYANVNIGSGESEGEVVVSGCNFQ